MKRSNLATKLCASLLVLSGVFLPTAQAAQAENGRYVFNNAEVYDTETNLTWQRCSVGLSWVEGLGCNNGEKKQLTFEEAQQQSDGTWRLPNKSELASLIAKSMPPTIDRKAFPDMRDGVTWYWSASPKDAANGWYVNFNLGHTYYSHRSYTCAVRLVRSGH